MRFAAGVVGIVIGLFGVVVSTSPGASAAPGSAAVPALAEDAVLFSTDRAGTVGGQAIGSPDIVAYDPVSDRFHLYFDGSDVGIDAGVDAFERIDDGSLLISLSRPQRLDGIGRVDDSDIVRFIPSSLGSDTAGVFEVFFDGSDVGLTTAAEDVDAIAVSADGDLVLSTNGSVASQSFRGKGQDLFVVRQLVTGADTDGRLSIYLDGSEELLQKASEGINGASIGVGSSAVALSTTGRYNVGLTGTGDDIFVCAPDTVDDAAVGACRYSLLFRQQVPGRVDAVDIGGPAQLDLPCLDCGAISLEFLIDDPEPADYAQFGSKVAVLGDVSGDGVSDLVVTAANKPLGGVSGVGAAFVASGADGSILYQLPHPEPQRSSSFGRAVAVVGLIDEDSVPDVAIGAPGHDGSGEVFVVSGADGSPLYSLISQVQPRRSDSFFGTSVAAIGDLDGDGVTELAVGSEGSANAPDQPQGLVTVFSGIDGSVHTVIENPDPDADVLQLFGSPLVAMGDTDNDGVPDFAAGAWQQDRTGAVFVLSGADGTVLTTIAYPTGQVGRDFGRRVAAIDDLDGDGVTDLAVAADLETVDGVSGVGAAFLFSGADGTLLWRLDDPFPVEYGVFGRSLADLGDLTGDGHSEIAVGVPGDDRVAFFSGADGSFVGTLSTPAGDEGGRFGNTLAAPDGPIDLAVAAPLLDVGSVTDRGRVYGFSLADLRS